MGAKYCLVLRPSVKLRFWRGFFEGILLVNLDIKTYLLGRSHSSCSLDSPVSTALCFFPPDSIRKRELLRFLLYFKYKKNCMCALLSLGAGAAAGCRCCVCLGLGPLCFFPQIASESVSYCGSYCTSSIRKTACVRF